jgi:hypothetical protein
LPGGNGGGGASGGSLGDGGGADGGNAVQSHTAGRFTVTPTASGKARVIGSAKPSTTTSSPHRCSLTATTGVLRADAFSSIALCTLDMNVVTEEVTAVSPHEGVGDAGGAATGTSSTESRRLLVVPHSVPVGMVAVAATDAPPIGAPLSGAPSRLQRESF